ncbi:hypothetical protein L9F63_020995, partial [Diploptera punctata]
PNARLRKERTHPVVSFSSSPLLLLTSVEENPTILMRVREINTHLGEVVGLIPNPQPGGP